MIYLGKHCVFSLGFTSCRGNLRKRIKRTQTFKQPAGFADAAFTGAGNNDSRCHG